jgi:hypothetical protein
MFEAAVLQRAVGSLESEVVGLIAPVQTDFA